MGTRRRRRFVAIGAVVVLLGAILPNAAYMGHWDLPGLRVVEAPAGHDHASHCHGDSSCADQAADAVPWWREGEDGLLLDGGTGWAQAPQQAPSAVAASVLLPDPPPRTA